MARTKKRNIDEIYDLKKIIKEKDELIKFLERRLKKEEKLEKKNNKKKPEPVLEVIPVESDACMSCGGKLEFTSLGFRTLVHCLKCKERKIIKNG